MSEIKALTKLLGGRSVLGSSPTTDEDLIALVREGLPYGSFEHVAKVLETSLDEVAASLDLPRSNLSRRKRAGTPLRKDESEKVMRLARIALRAEEVLGSMEKAYRWLGTPNRALGGKKPFEMLDVDLGAEKVSDTLGRIEHGVYS